MRAHQLRHVLSPVEINVSIPSAPAGQRADDIIRFHARDLQQRQTKRLHQGMQGFDLRGQIIWHRRTVGLVLGEQVIPKGFAAGIENHREVAWPVFRQQAAQHIDDTIDRAGRLAA
jgi:hypothetical protein